MILAVDTSGATGVAVVGDDGSVVAERVSDDPRGHAETIGPLLAEVLAAAAGRIDAVAYGVGPGPFTGLRVGMAAARAAALALGVPELPVLSHDAIALAAIEDGAPGRFAVVTDAKRREHHVTVYSGADASGLPVRAEQPAVVGEPPALPQAGGPVRPALVGRVAALRRRAGLPADPPEARYLRSPDVTLSSARRP
ncbi:tRNA (adenosine(37)-N6)-threonylcarbamoyltransferase complex dimerization subunit type 1 TsaB [Amnibacterium sp. CER49]|uniref:tRNA (adenosine(37)-N6)-threonylcarbamoyltransferase complex dimerization subunit type 1 TsaB n=1 Tax=Amnibacterium sp. CER49 TaxID=3039161 RepID=UPI002446ACE6|nr:tRNA (adenosine(37)-N6)-threonylcarbamoyltransferase complex dimerization subunit type 1 TsaB [Amnibacterium sp. CER49]MDH2443942.1 tRNA (adenosine(37)-N6)-threonylcarbamoyltransferase complex dimerization subunit type 1 TsaB [Amnibacterium sp. CER49]